MSYQTMIKDPFNKYVVVVDIDGTISDCSARLHHIAGKPKNYDAFNAECVADKLIEPVAMLVRGMRVAGFTIVFVTGRSEAHREATELWLRDNYLLYGPVFMRPADDYRSDYIVKMELVEKHVGFGRVVFAIEDRDRVVKAWRSRGITCFQPCEGTY